MSAMLRLSPEQLKAHMDRMAQSLPVRKITKLDAHKPVIGGDAAVKENKAWVKPKARSKGEEGLELALRAAKAPAWVSEYRFMPERRYRADFAFLEARLLVEVEGGQWVAGGGRHNRGDGYSKDIEKYNEMTIQGWRLLRVTTGMVEDGRALGYIMRALNVSERKRRLA
ncbi:MAG: endonuclease domain-containing protein [Gallionella sp.]|nr:endonuclease domain-containing protein [Gallionella sp.]